MGGRDKDAAHDQIQSPNSLLRGLSVQDGSPAGLPNAPFEFDVFTRILDRSFLG